MGDLHRLLLFGIAACVVILVTVMLARIVEAVSNATSAVERVPAIVAAKREETDSSWVITFDLADESVTLTVPKDVYDTLAKGARGTLTHKGTRFIGFDPS